MTSVQSMMTVNRIQAMADALKFLQTHSATSDDAMVDLCHVLLNSNEFLYVD